MLIFLATLCVNPPSHWEAPGTGRTCNTGQLYKTLFLGHNRAIHTPASSVQVPHPAALPGGFTGLPTTHLAGVVTGTPPQGGKGGRRPQEGPGQLLTSWGEAGVCRGAARKATKSRQWFRNTRKRGRSITNQTPDLAFSQGRSFSPAWSEAITS